ncbi:unnamed protein product, partial [Discosporangium mesarthrocarpum]
SSFSREKKEKKHDARERTPGLQPANGLAGRGMALNQWHPLKLFPDGWPKAPIVHVVDTNRVHIYFFLSFFAEKKKDTLTHTHAHTHQVGLAFFITGIAQGVPQLVP